MDCLLGCCGGAVIPPVCMNPCTVTIRTANGAPSQVDAWDIGVPGLVVAVMENAIKRYSIIHRPTGFSVSGKYGNFHIFEDAVGALVFLSTQSADWSHPDLTENPAKFAAATKALGIHTGQLQP